MTNNNINNPSIRQPSSHPRPSISKNNKTSPSSNLGVSFSSLQPPSLRPESRGSPALPTQTPRLHPLNRKPSHQQLTTPSHALHDRAKGALRRDSSDHEGEGGSSPFVMAPSTPAAGMTRRMVSMGAGANNTGGDIEVGDLVDVPGDMYGVVKFVGKIKGKGPGVFAGVELASEFAGRGKNDGDVDGRSLFTTALPGSGIFLPVNKAIRKDSPTISTGGSFPPTPTTPSLSAFNIGGRANLGANGFTPPTPSMSKFSQSVGPGRAASPALKPKSRPSLPRPESPLRKQQTVGSTAGGRPSLVAPSLAKNGLGGSRYGASPTPGKFGSSIRATPDPGKKLAFAPKTPTLARPASRTQTNLGPEPLFDEEDADTPTVGAARGGDSSALQSARSSGAKEDQVQVLKGKLEERDRQLKEQASSLAEMEKSLTELQSLLPEGGGKRRSRDREGEDADVTQLRALLREKNEKISMLTAEFDAHRADFRSTIDTLEMASTETERVYEKRVDDLLQELRELQDRGEDVESVARQLKQLEELVQELEEGLEDARRGEAEARGEVEFLRGEVERGRSELKREREKAAAALKGAPAVVEDKVTLRASKDLEQRDDEIRGLKAIIHSLSRDSMISDIGSPNIDSKRNSKQQNGNINGIDSGELNVERIAREKLERQVKELEGLIERKAYREEELERQLERMKTSQALEKHQSVNSLGSHRLSDRTVLAGDWREQANQNDIPPVPQLETMLESDGRSSVTDGSALWCEICETGGHDILTCTNMFGGNQHALGRGSPHSQRSQRTGRDVVIEGLRGLSSSPRHSEDRIRPLSPKKSHSPGPTPKVAQGNFSDPMQAGMVAGKASGVIDETKWCALCERDGHESVDCPFEDAF